MAAFHCLPTRHPHMLRLLPAASAFASSVITITPVCQVRDSQVSKSFPLSLVLEAVQRVQGGRMPRERGRERSGETVQALTCTACIYLHCDCVYLHFVLHNTFSQCAFARFFYNVYICTVTCTVCIFAQDKTADQWPVSAAAGNSVYFRLSLRQARG